MVIKRLVLARFHGAGMEVVEKILLKDLPAIHAGFLRFETGIEWD